ncbi:MAG: LON peptidase substrate-binding domain-containing protein, partial [Cyanobacteriota bacterium]
MTELAVRELPLFPLPDVVLFPQEVLPLHIFESRYRMMLRTVMAED